MGFCISFEKTSFLLLSKKIGTNFYLSLIFIQESLILQGIKSIIEIEIYYKEKNLNFTQAWKLKPRDFFTTLTS